ncbi:MAG: thiamine phosphate synthase [bacterium]|nr:thiamine phosphate synthase [bacterium]MDT8395208.1 thiamine phosphate synthase [bacterium]
MKAKAPFDPLLYLVTDPELSLGRSEVEVVRRAVAAGVTMVQYRDKNASTRVMIEKTRSLAKICRESAVPLIVNDRLDVALAGGAHGVHLGQDDMDPGDCHEIAGTGFIIGVSVTTVEEVRKAEKAGADYVAANGVFPTGTKTDLGEPLGLTGLAELAAATDLPLIAIGGIDDTNAGQIIEAGGTGVALVSFIVGAEDIEGRCGLMLSALHRAKS